MAVEKEGMKLLILSDTPFYLGEHGAWEAYEPTLREVESVSSFFSEIQWLGYLRSQSNPGNARCPFVRTIQLNSLPVLRGGQSIWAKLRILPRLPLMSVVILKEIRRYDVIHTRGPSIPAFIAILWSFVLRKKTFWHKYAGNWMQPNPPFMYGLQKRLLFRAAHSRVTINGNWPRQPKHVFSFENPSFTLAEWQVASSSAKHKSFDGRLILCYAGLIDEAKGVIQLMNAFAKCTQLQDRVQKIVIAGDGPSMAIVVSLAEQLRVPVEFPGYLSRERLNSVYLQSHALILPSATEGFPKVVAEAAAFGCIPIVTDVSSIGQYVIHESNGFLLDDNQTDTIAMALDQLLSSGKLKQISKAAVSMSAAFTYERFVTRVGELILGDVRG